MQRTILAMAMSSAACALLISPDAAAQALQAAAVADVMAGIEGGGSGYASGIRRTRTTFRFGAELGIDEMPNDSLAATALVEVEPTASFGADLRYQRRVADVFMFHVGALAIIAPKHMIGATFGAAYRIPLGGTFELSVGPQMNIYFVGADLPGSQVLWQGMLGGGARVQF